MAINGFSPAIFATMERNRRQHGSAAFDPELVRRERAETELKAAQAAQLAEAVKASQAKREQNPELEELTLDDLRSKIQSRETTGRASIATALAALESAKGKKITPETASLFGLGEEAVGLPVSSGLGLANLGETRKSREQRKQLAEKNTRTAKTQEVITNIEKTLGRELSPSARAAIISGNAEAITFALLQEGVGVGGGGGAGQPGTPVRRTEEPTPLTEDEAKVLLQQSGGDRDKARQLAKELNRTF